MSLLDPLKTNLLDLLFELRDQRIPLTIGGGFGLYLKRQYLDQIGQETLFKQLPESRATNDLDLFIRADILVDFNRTNSLAEAIHRLGYEVVKDAEYMQWRKEILVHGTSQEIKLDLLVGPLGDHRARLHVKSPRVRPKGPVKLHAHAVEEALHIDEEPLELMVTGDRSTGEPFEATVLIPHPFPYLMMKLFAFRDRKEDARKDLGRHHALDLYHIVGMMTEKEYKRSVDLASHYRGHQHVSIACDIVGECFSAPENLGVLRLREHRLFRNEFDVDTFISVLRELFSV